MRTPDIEMTSDVFRRVVADIGTRTLKPELDFGLEKLDQKTFGLPMGKVTVIGARTSEGKTSFALQQALRWSMQGHPILYISLEDSKEALVEKMYSNMYGVCNTELKAGRINKQLAEKAENMFDHLSLMFLNNFGYNYEEIKQMIDDTRNRPKVIFIDYIGMIEVARGSNLLETISGFMVKIKRLCLNEKYAIVVMGQINRTGAQDHRPQLHHLKACGSLEEVADLVLLLHYPKRHAKQTTFMGDDIPEEEINTYFEIDVAKNKYGETGIVPLKFEGQYSRFSNANEFAMQGRIMKY